METSFIGRQPLFSIDEEIFAYELLFRTSKRHNRAQISNQSLATAQVLHHALNSFGLDRLLNGRKGFLNVNRDFLFDRFAEAVPADRFILEIDAREKPDPILIERIAMLKSSGYRFAVDDMEMNDTRLLEFTPLFELADLVKIDVMATDMATLDQKLGFFQQYGMEVLAEKVETYEMLEQCRNMGFDYAQGYFFARPDVLETPKVEPVQLGVIELIEKIMSGCDMKEIENAFANDPKLTLNLLKYINASHFSTRKEISSIRQAVSLLGRDPLLHWLMLVLYAGTSDSKHREILLHTVMLRAELMGAMAQRYQFDLRQRAKAYLIGMVSLLNALLKVPMARVFEEIRFDQEITRAVLGYEGRMGKLLQMVTIFERAHFPTTQSLLKRLQMSEKELYHIMHQSYARVMAQHTHLL